MRKRGIVLIRGELDEAPPGYRRLPEVLAAQGEIRVLHRLRPFGVVMAG